MVQYSPLLSEHTKRQIAQAPPQGSIKDRFPRDQLVLSELPQFLNGTYRLDVPVYTVWGACEDVQVLEKLRSGEYKIDNLHIIDEAHSRLLDVSGVKLRLLGLGGAVVMHKLFDNGEGRTTIAGGQGTMWTTLLQMGELVDTANRVYDPTETRVFVTHASPAREGLLNQLSVTLKADFSISAGLHFRYGSSYNEFSVNPSLDHYRGKLAASRASFNDVWETVKTEVEPAVSENEAQQRLLQYAIDIVQKMPSVANGGNPFGGQVGGAQAGQVDESAFKNMWNFNLADAAYGWLVLDVDNGRIGTEMRAQGFNFAHRGGKVQPNQAQQAPASVQSPAPIPPGGPTANVPQQSQSARPSGPQGFQGPPNRGPGSHQANRTGPSPVAAPAPKDGPKAATPTPAAAANPSTPSADKASDSKTNGASDRPTPGSAEPPKPSQALFIRNVKSEDEARNTIPEDERSKITKVHQQGQAYVIHFANTDEMQNVLGKVNKEYKQHGGPDTPNVRVYQERPFGSGRGGGRGGFSERGGAHQGPAGSQGYRSGGASDSEGGRGRGGFRGRGDRGRGGERGRGDRGRGGRGGPQKVEGAASPAGATGGSTPGVGGNTGTGGES